MNNLVSLTGWLLYSFRVERNLHDVSTATFSNQPARRHRLRPSVNFPTVRRGPDCQRPPYRQLGMHVEQFQHNLKDLPVIDRERTPASSTYSIPHNSCTSFLPHLPPPVDSTCSWCAILLTLFSSLNPHHVVHGGCISEDAFLGHTP